MGGSKGGKHSKRKAKSRKKPETSTSRISVAQISDINPDGPKDSNKQHLQLNKVSSMTESWSIYTEEELEEFLHIKLETLYGNAKSWLSNSGYSMTEVEGAILNAGYLHGPMDLQNNILKNSLAFIENKTEVKREPFKDMDELHKAMLEVLVVSAMQAHPNIQRSEAMWQLLVGNWCSLPATTSNMQTGDLNSNTMLACQSHASSSHGKNEDVGALDSSSSVDKVPSESKTESSLKKVGVLERVKLKPALVSHLVQNVPILAATLRREIGASVIMQHSIPFAHVQLTEVPNIMITEFLNSMEACLRTNSDDDPRTALLIDLVKDVRSLHAKLKEQREWAEQKVVNSAKRLSRDFIDLRMLRLEKMDSEQLKIQKVLAEKTLTLKLLETEQLLRNMSCEANHLTVAVEWLEEKNARMRADIEALKLNALESDRESKVVLKGQKKWTKKLAEISKQKTSFQALAEEDKQRVGQSEHELLQADKEAEEAEIERRNAIKEKELMIALLAEETKIEETRKAYSRAELLKLCQKIEIDSQLAMDDCRRLEDELSSLLVSHQMSNVFLEDHIFSFNHNIEGTSSGPSAPDDSYEKIIHWVCMMCIENEVDVVFLPCTHQVVCLSCYEARCKAAGQCPCCQVQIEQRIRVYGPSS